MDNCINLKDLKPDETADAGIKPEKPKKKKSIWKRVLFSAIFLLVIVAIFFNQANTTGQSNSSWLNRIPIFGNIKQIVEGADKKLKGEERDRINILLLGIGGKNHDGGMLTDTIMVVSIQPSTKKVAMVSIPRDLTVPIENMGWRKINNVNAFAEMENPGSGGLAISQTVSDTLDIPIDYYVRVDFQGFINIINDLGGLDVYVDNTLDDYDYPVLGNEDAYPYSSRYEHLHVDQGWQKMDGDLALKFARSRHGIRGEGSDFARAKRQQKIIQAVKDKVMSMNFLLNPTKISDTIGELQDHISTNLQVWEMLKLWSIAKNIKSDSITNKVLDNSPGGYLVSSFSSEGAYILSPRSGDFAEIQYMVKNLFTTETLVDVSKVTEEKSSIEVYNGTWINGLASRVSTDLEKDGFSIQRIGNSSRKDFQKSIIYDLTNGKKSSSLSVLKQKTDADVSTDMPQWLKDDLEKIRLENGSQDPDFVLILGHAADNTSSGIQNQVQ